MKLAGREAARFLARPDPALAGVLLYGADPMRVALKRAALVEALIGPDGGAEMRLTRLAGADLRRDPAALLDAVKAVGFFPGARVVLVEDAGDAVADTLRAALADWRPGDAQVVVTAGALGAGSALRKAFEAARERGGGRRLCRPAGARRDRGGAGEGRRAAGARGDGRHRGAGADARPGRLRAVPGEARALQARRRGAGLGRRPGSVRAAGRRGGAR